ncbi:MAG: hypothetical protein ACJAXA_003177, partial [Candidatus Aldehydirespiratoraceae bacterium]
HRSGDAGQLCAQQRDRIVGESVPNPTAPLVAGDQCCLTQYFEMVRNGWLRLAKRSNEVTRTHFAVRRVSDHRQDLKPNRVGDGAELLGQRLGCGARHPLRSATEA